MDAETVLVIILSCTLAVFLVIGIIALVQLIKVLKSLNRITAKAEKLVESAESVGEFFKNATGTMAVGKFVHNITHYVKRKEKEK